jgi:predicted NAD/FAD-binding protein
MQSLSHAPRRRIAIIGSGISGLTTAYMLRRRFDITLFEAAGYIGGHANTIDVENNGERVSVDTGFIVYNERTYPNFCRLLDELQVPTQASDMSFSVHCDRTGLEYKGDNLNTLFGQRRNLLRPSFHHMWLDILRFNRSAPKLLAGDSVDHSISLSEYLRRERFSRPFIDHYITPMGAAIWSSTLERMGAFPAVFFIRFFQNHGLLSVFNRPIWRVISGGSARYVERLTASIRNRIRLNTPVQSVRRTDSGVVVQPRGGESEVFDDVVFASHSDQTLRMLVDADATERSVLGSFPYQSNEAVLHTDERLLPVRKRCWASWNYHLRGPEHNGSPAAVTYHMNRLQSFSGETQYCVTLNHTAAIRPAKILKTIEYHHPVFTPATVAAQLRHGEVSGRNRAHFCGAYWGNGFHEDGVRSALAVCRQLGVTWDNKDSAAGDHPEFEAIPAGASDAPTLTPAGI